MARVLVPSTSTNLFHPFVSYSIIHSGQKHQQGYIQKTHTTYVKMLCKVNNNSSIQWQTLGTSQPATPACPCTCLRMSSFSRLQAVRSSNNSFEVSSDLHSKVINECNEAVGAGIGGANSGNKTTTILENYGTDLTKLAEQGTLDPVTGWQQQIERITKILDCHWWTYSVCLVGQSGVGKKAIVEGLAQRIADGDVPGTIQGKKVIRLEMGLLRDGTKTRTKFLASLKKLVKEIKQSKNIILFNDEVHTLFGKGIADDAIAGAKILKPALARGKLQCIGATTLDEYRKHIKKDPVFLRGFEVLKVPESSVDETIQILKTLRERYEIRHMLRYTDDALVAAAKLSYHYIRDQFLPDEAIYLIDRAGSRTQFRNAQLHEESKKLENDLEQITTQKYKAIRSQDWEKAGDLSDRETDLRNRITSLVNMVTEISKDVVTEIDIQQLVSSMTGIPIDKISSEESNRGLKVEEALHRPSLFSNILHALFQWRPS